MEYQQVLIPQRVATVTAAQQEFNYMLIGAFELIALKQDEYDTYQGYLEAISDYWTARAELGLAAGAALPSNARIGDQLIDADRFIRPATTSMDHSAHGSMSGGTSMDGMEDKGTMPMDHSGHTMMNGGTLRRLRVASTNRNPAAMVSVSRRIDARCCRRHTASPARIIATAKNGRSSGFTSDGGRHSITP